MVRRLNSRARGSSRGPTTEKRHYVDFDTVGGSKAAVEKWLDASAPKNGSVRWTNTSRPKTRRGVSFDAMSRKSDSGVNNRQISAASVLERRSAMSSPGDAVTFEKRHLKEKFRSKMKIIRSSKANMLQKPQLEPSGDKIHQTRSLVADERDDFCPTEPCTSTLSCLSINAQDSVDVTSMVVQPEDDQVISSPVSLHSKSSKWMVDETRDPKTSEASSPGGLALEKDAARSLGPLFHSDHDSQSERDSPPSSKSLSSKSSHKSKQHVAVLSDKIDDAQSSGQGYDIIAKALQEEPTTVEKPVEQISIPEEPNTKKPFSKKIAKDKLHGPFISNRVKLHIYDLISKEVKYELPLLGVTVPVGSYFSVINQGLHKLGTGAYHVGIEINGVEYAYGANSIQGTTGVFTCMPKKNPVYQYRKSIDFGERTLTQDVFINCRGQQVQTDPDTGGAPAGCFAARVHVDGRDILKQMTKEYLGADYDLLRKNCCTFAFDACLRLGIDESTIPRWFLTLHQTGAYTQDLALSATRPITSAISKVPCNCEVAIPRLFAKRGLQVIKDRCQDDQTLQQLVDVESRSQYGDSLPSTLINDTTFR